MAWPVDKTKGDEIQAAQDRLAAEGRYLIAWRKVGGAWRMHRDMFNTL